MTAPSDPRVLVVGEALVDVIHRPDGTLEERPGGSPANVALALGRLGLAPVLATCLGADERGDAVEAWLGASGVTTLAHRMDHTSVAIAHLDASGAAEYEFDIRWDAGALDLPAADVVHVGSIGAILGASASHLIERLSAVSGSSVLAYDPNVRPSLLPDRGTARARIESIVRIADVVKASDEDLRWLYPDADPVDSARRWSRWGPALVVVTLGGDGAHAIAGEIEIRVPAVATRVVDTVGAGDSFMGAMIAGIVASGLVRPDASASDALDRDALESILRASAEAAAVTVSRLGADPPTASDLTLIDSISATRAMTKE